VRLSVSIAPVRWMDGWEGIPQSGLAYHLRGNLMVVLRHLRDSVLV
jgi:hypothetical protein